jgi:hypothetical protein
LFGALPEETWLKSLEAATEGQKLPFLLITPVQRIPRYNLLLQELIKKTPEGHADHTYIIQALGKIKEITDHVNFSVREQENRVKLLKIAEDTKKYIGFEGLLLPHRSLIHEGDVKLPTQDKTQWMLQRLTRLRNHHSGKESKGETYRGRYS